MEDTEINDGRQLNYGLAQSLVEELTSMK